MTSKRAGVRLALPYGVGRVRRAAAYFGPPQTADLRSVSLSRRSRGCYPVSAGGLWLCRTLVLSGFQAVVVPSGFRTRVQPHRWITTWWWKKHSSKQSRVLVLPPSFLCLTWCTSQAEAGWLHPPGCFRNPHRTGSRHHGRRAHHGV